MFAKRTVNEIAIRIVLIAIVVFNAAVPSAALGKYGQPVDTASADETQLLSPNKARTNYIPLQFEHPIPRLSNHVLDKYLVQASSPITIACYLGVWDPWTGFPYPCGSDLNSEAGYWKGTISSETILRPGSPIATVHFSLNCPSSSTCSEANDVYYKVSMRFDWTHFYGGNTSSFDLSLGAFRSSQSTVIRETSTQCGPGQSGSCTVELIGVIENLPSGSDRFHFDITRPSPLSDLSGDVTWDVQLSLEPILFESTVFNSCSVVPDECQLSAPSNTQGVVLNPINTRTGGLFYQTKDIGVQTIAKELSFFRTYSSLATDKYVSTLGYGWTHSLDTHLIFPDDPGGENGYVIFKAHSANQYRFAEDGGVYTPAPGVIGNLIYANGQYTLTNPNQSVYVFDVNGKLQTWADSKGNTWQYTYNINGLLDQVSANGGTRYLNLSYDVQGRIISVTDQTGREITFAYDANGDLISMTDVLGEVWEYEYDTSHRLTRVVDPLGNTVERTEYDAQGRAIRQYDGLDNLTGELSYNANGASTVTDNLGNTITHTYDYRGTLTTSADSLNNEVDKTYDSNFRPVSITDPAGDTTTLTWSADGANLTRIVDAEGNQTDITYNALNLPTSVIDPRDFLTTFTYSGTLLTNTTNALNQTTTYTYTPEGYLASVTDPLNHTTSYTYDSQGQRISMTDPLNNTWTYSYDSLGRMVDSTDPLGHVTHNVYDAAGRLTLITQNYDVNKVQNEDNQWNIVTTYSYDARGNQISVTDTLGRVTLYEYDDASRLTKIIDPAGNETVNTYNAAGQLISVKDALNRITQYAYDNAGRLISTTDALGGISGTSYNPDGTVASTTDALGRVTTYVYDSLKRVITVTQPNGGQVQNTYDENGNVATATDALGNVTTYEYDALNRPIKTTDTLGNFTETFYDSAGRMVQMKDARGSATTFAYDAAGRQTTVTDALGNITTYEYDALGRRTSMTDANGNETTFTYDQLSRTVTVTDALGHSSTSAYDALGQTLTQTDANNNSISFAYNNLNQLTSQTDALSNITTFTYDAVGNQLTVKDANNHTTATEYDALNRPTTFTDANNNASSNSYDLLGNVLTSTDALGNETTYAYNTLNQPTTITDPLNHATQNLYNARGDLILTTDAEGIVTRYEYDALSRLTAVIENYQAGIPADTQTNVRTEYTYDENGNRLTIKDANGQISNFAYDALNRLVTETDALNHTWTYTYDDAGNRISMTDANGTITNYVYDDANQLVTINYPSGPDTTFTYDNAGRRLTMTDGLGTTAWNYDDANRPISITDPFNAAVQYAYDPVGNRTALTYPGGQAVNYTYDNANRLTTVTSDQVSVASYQYDAANRLTGITRPNGVNTTYQYDANSWLQGITHAAGIEVLGSYQYQYDNVGNRIQAIENVLTPPLPPTATPTNTPTDTPTSTPTDTPTSTATFTPTNTPTPLTSGWISPAGNAAVTSSSGDNNGFQTNPANAYSDNGTFTKDTNSGTNKNTACNNNGKDRHNFYTYDFSSIPSGASILGIEVRLDMKVDATAGNPKSCIELSWDGGTTWTATQITSTFTTTEATYILGDATNTWGRAWTTNELSNFRVRITNIASNNARDFSLDWIPVQVSYLPPAPTATFTPTDTSTPIPPSTPTPTASATSTQTSTPISTPTLMITDTPTHTPAITDTPTITATPNPSVIVDEFDSALLSTDWEWYVPQTGPDYSLSAEPGSLQLVVQPDKDHWIDIDSSPQVRRRDMGSGDWAIETYLALDETNIGDQWQINLMAGFDRYDQQWLTIGSDNQLEVQRAGADETAILTGISLPLYLRIEKSGSQYAFKYKQDSGDPWTTLDTQTIASPVSYVGLQVRTFYTSIGDTVFNMDYFRLERSNPPDPGPEKEIEHDEFDSPTLNPDWTWYVPKAGPTYSLNAGTFRMSLPPNDSFEHWIGVDEAPQLRRVDLGTGDWAIETRLENVNASVDAGWWAALEVGYDQYDHTWFGMVFDGDLYAFVMGTGDETKVDENTPLILRLEKIGTEYTFKYKYDPNEAWTVLAPKSYAAAPQYVGLITRSWQTGTTELQSDWSYFRIERWESQGALMMPQGNAGAITLDEQNEKTQSDEIEATPTQTPTRKPSPTPTRTATPPQSGVDPALMANLVPVNFKLPAFASAPQQQSGPVTIDYVYDPLYRLKEANYSNGDQYHYTYDAVGNRLTQETLIGSVPLTNNYVYDAANRLTSVDGVAYTWDNNGNLLNDGVNTYAYDSANRLTSLSNQSTVSSYQYNGLGDRLSQNGVNYTLDLNAGLTQILSDGTNTYLYGLGRIAQVNATTDYFLTDALGSVRQLTNEQGQVTLANTYDPYGVLAQTAGSAQSSYGFTGEFTDASGLVYLRARYYAPEQGRFTTRDTWEGDNNSPQTLNRYVYTVNNPILFTDPSGNCPIPILCQLLIGGVVGSLTGAAIGATYGSFMYDLALQGKCGCEGIQIIQQYSKSQFMLKAAGQGAIFGAVFGGLAFLGAGGVATAALAGMGLSSAGIINALQRLTTDPHNECAWWDLGLSLFGLVTSGFAFRASAARFFYNKAVQYESSPAAIIGKYREGSPFSYEQLGKKLGFSNINLETPYFKYFKLVFGENAWWRLINEPFIRAIARAKKTVYVNQDPNLPTTGNLASEISLLTRELGYVEDGFIRVNGSEIWRLIPTR